MDGVYFLSLLTVAANAIFVAVAILYLWSKVSKSGKTHWLKVEKYLSVNSLKLAFVVATTATLGSLYLSEIRGFEPCKLCWLQRIFMYPIPIILGVAIIKKLKEAAYYVLPLSVVGGLIGIYHYYYQVTGSTIIPCSTVGFSVSCSERFFTHFGYITIPWMSFSAFAIIFFLMLLSKRAKL